MKAIIVILTVFFIFNQQLHSQERKWLDFLPQEQEWPDFLNYKYKYLDENYNILVDSTEFNETVAKYKFYPERIINYKDSLAIVMMLEFGDWKKCRGAVIQITYSWLRLGYHIWKSPVEAEEFAFSYGIFHPWKMKMFLTDEKNNDEKIINLYNNLKDNIAESDSTIVVDSLSRSRILDLALLYNPERMKDWQRKRYIREHGKLDEKYIGKGCGKKNCCQTRKK